MMAELRKTFELKGSVGRDGACQCRGRLDDGSESTDEGI